MTIETKYNIGDKVWVMDSNKPCENTIHHISVEVDTQVNLDPKAKSPVLTPARPDFRYKLNRSPGEARDFFFSEANIFNTREELLNSL